MYTIVAVKGDEKKVISKKSIKNIRRLLSQLKADGWKCELIQDKRGYHD